MSKEKTSASCSEGAELITAERQRQIEVDGWTPEHDEEHDHSELSRAALCYARLARLQAINPDASKAMPYSWPWHSEWWKPSDDPIRFLVSMRGLCLDFGKKSRP